MITPQNVLVVDDEDAVRSLLQIVLETHGFSVRAAADGVDAMAILASGFEPDAIVSDLQMPRMDGLKLLAATRASHAEVPFLFVTSFPELEAARAAIRLGAYDFINKPFDAEMLAATVTRAVEARQLRRRARLDAAELLSRFERLQALDRARRTLLGVVVEEVDEPLGTLRSQLELLGSGLIGEIGGQIREVLDAAAASAARIARVVRNVADIHLITSDERHVGDSAVDMRLLVCAGAEAEARAAAEQRGLEPSLIRVATKIPPQPAIVRGDPDLLDRAVRAILRFALLRVSPGEPIIAALREIAPARGAADGGAKEEAGAAAAGASGTRAAEVSLVVEDRGPVLAPGLLDRLLAPDEQADLVAAGLVPDLTLALPLARLAARAHGGRLVFLPGPGPFATLELILPRATAPGAAEARSP